MSGKPKRWKSWRVCPECGSRATKLFSVNSGKLECQICNHEYDPPAREAEASRKSFEETSWHS